MRLDSGVLNSAENGRHRTIDFPNSNLNLHVISNAIQNFHVIKQYLPDVLLEMQLPCHHSLQDLWSMYCKLILPQVLPIYKCTGKKLHEGETTYPVSATFYKNLNFLDNMK